MKFSLFVHMERYDESVSHAELFEQVLELSLMAEAGGFSTIWTGEHHSMEYTISPSPMPLLSYLAARTTRIRLGAGTLIAPFWHPIRAAGECALLDVISNGRAEIGLARGAYQFEFDRLGDGMPATSGGKHLREMVPILPKLWQGDYAHEGEIWKFPVSTSSPRPLQKPYPPIWVAARDPDSHNFAVKNGCNVMVTPLMKGDEEVVDLVGKFENALKNNPEVARPQLMVLRHTHVHTEPEGWEVGAKAIAYFYRSFEGWFRNNQQPVDGFVQPISEEEVKERPEYDLNNIRKNVMIGTPEEVIARIRHYQELGVDEFSFWADNSLPFEEKKRSLQLFIDHVIPAFR